MTPEQQKEFIAKVDKLLKEKYRTTKFVNIYDVYERAITYKLPSIHIVRWFEKLKEYKKTDKIKLNADNFAAIRLCLNDRQYTNLVKLYPELDPDSKDFLNLINSLSTVCDYRGSNVYFKIEEGYDA